MKKVCSLILFICMYAMVFMATSHSTYASHEPFTAHVLVYHSVRPRYESMSKEVKQYTVSPEMFEKQLKYLKDSGYTVISLDDLVNASKGYYHVPNNSVVITFDDGWENQYKYAFPLLQKYGMTATFFVFTNAPGHKNYITWDQLGEMVEAGMTIGSHSKSHPYLDRLTDEKQLDAEITKSKATIEAKLGIEVRAFAYPFGGQTPELSKRLADAGYLEARTFTGGIYHSGDDAFSIKATMVTEDLKRFKQLLLQ